MSTRTRPMTSDELLRFDDPSVRGVPVADRFGGGA
jgi:hypothetical protein